MFSSLAQAQRVSCAGLCRIRDEAGRYLLGLNANRCAQGMLVYAPLGGALLARTPDLLARFDAVPENAAAPDELRLYLPPDRLTEFRRWFYRRAERETTPFRELREELVDEYRVLPDLTPDDVYITHAGTVEAARVTERSGANGRFTAYFHDVFDVVFVCPDLWGCLLAVAPESGLRWFSDAELAAGAAADGALVDASILLDPP